MLMKITCMCGRASDWDFQSNNIFQCTCGNKLDVASVFVKNKFKIAILENLQKERKSASIIPNLAVPLLFMVSFVFPLVLIPAIIVTFKVIKRKRLVKNGYSVIGIAKKKNAGSDIRTLHLQPKGKKYFIQILGQTTSQESKSI